MDKMKTLHEICDSLGVTRRAVQGYERAELVCATDKNKYGYLLYNAEAEARIAQIKLYQDLGFTIKEIKDLIDAPRENVKEALMKQIQCLEKDRARMDNLIKIAYELLEIGG